MGVKVMMISVAGCWNKSALGVVCSLAAVSGRRHRQGAAGYSLVELLIVLVVIGIMLSITALSMGNFEADPAEKAINRLRYNVELLSNEAIIRSEMLGLGFFEDGYAFFRMDEDGNAWQLIEDDRLLKEQTFEAGVIGQAFLAGEGLVPSSRASLEPQIFAMPTGEITPFEYQVYSEQSENAALLKFDALGRVIKDEENPEGDAS